MPLRINTDPLQVTNRTNSSWGGFGVTIFDALDTLLVGVGVFFCLRCTNI